MTTVITRQLAQLFQKDQSQSQAEPFRPQVNAKLWLNPQGEVRDSAHICLSRLTADSQLHGSIALRQLESELYQTETYQAFMGTIASLAGEEFGLPTKAVNQLIHEAFQISWQRCIEYSSSVTANSGQALLPTATTTEAPQLPVAKPPKVATKRLPTQVPATKVVPTKAVQSSTASPKASTLGEAAESAWEQAVQTVGQQLKQWREAKELSLFHLHHKTHVPNHYLKALEDGRLDLLPEPVFIKGFIRRAATALGQDGVALVRSLPDPNYEPPVVPSWYPQPETSVLAMTPVQFGIGCGAVVVGALGGMHWLGNQTVQPFPASLDPQVEPQQAEPDNARNQPTNVLPTPNVAWPERIVLYPGGAN